VGSYGLSQIDVDDIAKFQGQEGATVASTLGHELSEQQEKQLGKLGNDNAGYTKAHAVGTATENAIIGATRVDGPPTFKTDFLNRVNGSQNTNYNYPNGKNVTVTVNVVKNNITSVSSKVQNPSPVKKKP